MINVAEALDDFLQLVKLKVVTRATVDFDPADTVVVFDIQAVVQPADMEKINPDIIDWSRKYKQIHSKVELKVGHFIEYKGADYKIVVAGDYNDYGYYETVGEETKQTLLEATA